MTAPACLPAYSLQAAFVVAAWQPSFLVSRARCCSQAAQL